MSLNFRLEESIFRMVQVLVSHSVYAHGLRNSGLFSVSDLTKHDEKEGVNLCDYWDCINITHVSHIREFTFKECIYRMETEVQSSQEHLSFSDSRNM